jgi:hypothetical protein
MITTYAIYDPSDGKIKSTFTGTLATLLLNVSDNELYVEGQPESGFDYYIDGQFVAKAVPEEQKIINCLSNLRFKRSLLFQDSDWTQFTDSPLTDEKKVEWATYRQALRDLPSQYPDETNIDNVVFPTPPEA